MKRTITVLLAAVALTALAVPTVSMAISGSDATIAAKKKKKPKPKTKTVGLYNYFFGPAKVALKVNDSIKFKWPAAGGDPHNVSLLKGPKGLKGWTSPTYTAFVSWNKKFTKAGNYTLVCTLHPDTMVMTVKVSK